MAFSLGAFRRSLLYQASATAGQVKANLTQIAEQDKVAESKKKVYIPIAIIAAIAAFGSLFLLEAIPQIIFVSIGLAIMAVITGIIASRWNRLDITDLRYELPQQLVDMLSRDMAKGSAIETRIDFSAPTKKKKKVRTEPWPQRSGWKQAFFEDPWLQLSGQFLDNTTFSFTLTDLNVVRSGWKRSRSGKMKHKSKTKPKGAEVQLVLRFPRKRYGAITALQSDLQRAVTLSSGVVLKQIKANDHQLGMRVKIPANSPLLHKMNAPSAFYKLFTQMLLSAYQVLNLSKELSKTAG